MPIVVLCPKCQSRLRAPDEIAGKFVRCKSCQERFQVPGTRQPGESNHDTQQLSTFSLPASLPVPTSPEQAIPPAPAKPVSPVVPKTVPAPDQNVFVPTAITPQAFTPQPEPLPLDDLGLQEAPASETAPVARAIPAPPVAAPPPAESLSADDLLEEPVASTAAKDDFTFDEPSPIASTKKKKRRREDEDDQEDEDTDDEEQKAKPSRRARDQKKPGAPWGILIGVGVLLVVIGGGAAAVFLGGGNKEVAEAKTPTTTPPTNTNSKLNIKPKGKETPNPNPDEGTWTKATGKGGGAKGESGGTTSTGPKTDPMNPGPRKPVTPPKEPKPPAVLPEPTLPMPPTGATKLLGKAKRKIPLPIPLDKIRSIEVSNDSVVVAFNSLPSFQGAGGKDTIRLYGLATGVKGREIVIDSVSANWTSAYAVSASDGLVAVETGGPGKVTVYDFESGSLVFDKLDVFAETAGRTGPIAALAIGTNRKLFVVDQAGAVDIWDLSTRQRTVTGTPPKRSGRTAPKACILKDGTTLALAIDAKVLAIGVNGAVMGKPITLENPASIPLAIGSSSVPDRVALAYQLPDGKAGIAAIRPLEGLVQFQALLPKAAGAVTQVSWPADTLLSVSTSDGDAGLLVDMETKAVTGYVKSVSTKASLFPLAGEFWWCLPDPLDAKKSLLLSAEMPFDGYFEIAKEAGNKKTPIYLVPQADGLAR